MAAPTSDRQFTSPGCAAATPDRTAAGPAFTTIGVPAPPRGLAVSSPATFIRQNKCCTKFVSALILAVFLVGIALFTVGANEIATDWCDDVSNACSARRTRIISEVAAGLAMIVSCCSIMTCCGCFFLVANLLE
jgi:hypothetical protein